MPSALQKSYHLALNAFEAKRYDEVHQICSTIIQSNPKYHKAYYLMATMSLELGQVEPAEEFISQALLLSPKQSDYLCVSANVDFVKGDYKAAETKLLEVLKTQVRSIEALALLGRIYLQQEKCLDAKAVFEKAVNIDPQNKFNLIHLATAQRQLEEYDLAIQTLMQLLALDAGYVEAHSMLAALFETLERTEQAAEYYQNAIALQPHNIDLIRSLSRLLNRAEYFEESQALIGDAISFNPGDVSLFVMLADVYYQRQFIPLALQALHTAFRLGASDEAFDLFAHCVSESTQLMLSDELVSDLSYYLEHEHLNPEPIGAAVLAVLQEEPAIRALGNVVSITDTQELVSFLNGEDCKTALNHKLFLKFVSASPIPDYRFELILTQLRKAFLVKASDQLSGKDEVRFSSLEKYHFDCLLSLAQQCHVNEYVYYADGSENSALELLEQKICERLAAEEKVGLHYFLTYACYNPISGVNQYDKNITIEDIDFKSCKEFFVSVEKLFRTQISEVEREQVIQKQIIPINSCEDPTSAKVQEQYEQNPYPRWRHHLTASSKNLYDAFVQQFPQLDESQLQGVSVSDKPLILVAGCGTGKDPIETAVYYKNSHVIALDLSSSSLAYAERRRQALGIENLAFYQADILNLELDQFPANVDSHDISAGFDMIQCNGVLHHMADPVLGWEKLSGLLKPGGLMKVGLYSAYARSDIKRARNFISEHGYKSSAADIRKSRREIMQLKEHNAISKIAYLWNDFYTLSNCRDLLFHVQEHQFTIPQLEQIIQNLGFRFLGFSFGTPEPLQRYKQNYPNDKYLNNLKNWHKLESEYPLTFKNMYQFWLLKV